MEKKYFDALVRGLEEVVAIEKGEIVPPPERVHRVPLPKDKRADPKPAPTDG